MGPIVGIVALVGTVYSAIQQRKAQKRAAAQARQAARDAAAISARVNPSGREVPLIYGRWGTYGTIAYVATGDNLPSLWVATVMGNLRPGKGLSNRRQYLLVQSILGVGPMSSVKHILIDDEHGLTDMDSKIYGTSAHHFWSNATAMASLYAKRFTQTGATDGRPGNTTGERTDNSKFTGFSYIDNFYFLNLDDPAYQALPEAFYICNGKGVPIITGAGKLQNSIVASDNAARVLLDYLVGSMGEIDYGPKIPFAEIDADSFRTAITVAGEVVQGAGNVDWNRGFPQAVNDNFKTKYDDYSDRMLGIGFSGINDSGLETWYGETISIIRYSFNGSIPTDKDYQATILQILESMPGAMFFRSLHAKWKLVLPDSTRSASAQSVGTITDDYLIGGLRIEYPDSSDKLNGLTGRYSNIQTDFAGESQYVHIEDGFAEDGNRDLLDTIDLIGCHNPYTAFARLRTEIMISRRVRYSFEMTARGYIYEPGDVIRLNSVRNAVDKYIRIESVGVNERLNIQIAGIEFEPSDYAFITGAKYTPEDQNTTLFSNPAPDVDVDFVTYGRKFQFRASVSAARGSRYDSLEFQKQQVIVNDPESPVQGYSFFAWGYLTTSGYWAFAYPQSAIPALRGNWIPGRRYETPLEVWSGNVQNSRATNWRARTIKDGVASAWGAETRIPIIVNTLDAELIVPEVSAVSATYVPAGTDPAKNDLEITVRAPETQPDSIHHYEAIAYKNRIMTSVDFDGNISKVLAITEAGASANYEAANPLRIGEEWSIAVRSAKINGVVGPYSTDQYVIVEDILQANNVTVEPTIEIVGAEVLKEGVAVWRWTVTIGRHIDNPIDFRIVWIHWKMANETVWKRFEPSKIFGAMPTEGNATIAVGQTSASFTFDQDRMGNSGAISIRARLSKYNAAANIAANVSRWGSADSNNQGAVLAATSSRVFASMIQGLLNNVQVVRVYVWIDRHADESSRTRAEVEMTWSSVAGSSFTRTIFGFGVWNVFAADLVDSTGQSVCFRMRYIDSAGNGLTAWTDYTCMDQPARSTLPTSPPTNDPTT